MDGQVSWQRYWAPRGAATFVDHGVLHAPSEFLLRSHIENYQTISMIRDTPCAVLLGSPGLGKSTCLRDEVRRLHAAVGSNESVLSIDLAALIGGADLWDGLRSAPQYQEWRDGDGTLHLFFDSLDECRQRMRNVADIIIAELAEIGGKDRQRLRFRIACRSGEWHTHFEQELRRLFPEDGVAVLELQPLTESDIEVAAASLLKGTSPAEFLQAVREREVQPLAATPLTLFMLLGIFGRDSELPPDRIEIYRRGTLHLCHETSERRRESGELGRHGARLRWRIAARVAMFTVICNRLGVDLGVPGGPGSDDWLHLGDLEGGSEEIEGGVVDVDEDALRDVLQGTGLFVSLDPQRLIFAHRTYAECLAAAYLIETSGSLAQVFDLCTLPLRDRPRVVPQLSEMVSWLTSMDPKLFDLICDVDPQVLLHSDAARISDEQRRSLARTMLSQLRAGRIHDRDWSLRAHYPKLVQEDIGSELGPVILDKEATFSARRVAIDIAEACKVVSLQAPLLQVALDEAEPTIVRAQAASAVARVGDAEHRQRLRPLLASPPHVDPDDELRGYTLMALWPDHLSAEDLFGALAPPRNENLSGIYRLFVWDLRESLRADHLVACLGWIRDTYKRAGPMADIFRDLVKSAFALAARHLETPEIAHLLAQALISRWGEHDDDYFRDQAQDDDPDWTLDEAQRRTLVRTLVKEVPPCDDRGHYPMPHCRTTFLSDSDLPWMLEQILSDQGTESRRVWALFIWLVMDWQNPTHTDAVVTVAEGVPELRERFKTMIEPVQLDSPEAEAARMHHQFMREHEAERQEDLEPEPTREEVAELLLGRFEEGHSHAWWQMVQMLAAESTRALSHSLGRFPFKEMPGWQEISAVTQRRVHDHALAALERMDPAPEEWIEKANVVHFPAWAGYCTLRHLLEEDDEALGRLSDEVWARWACAVVGCAGYPRDTDAQRLVRIALGHAPSALLDAMRTVLRACDEQHARDGLPELLSLCEGRGVEEFLLEMLRSPDLHPRVTGDIGEQLLRRGSAEGRAYLESLLTLPPPSSESERARAIQAGRVLLREATDEGWGAAWPAIQADPEFGDAVLREAMSVAGHREERLALHQRLPAQCAGDLHIHLMQRVPPETDPRGGGVRRLGPDDMLRDLRDGILGGLVERGTSEAVATLERIATEYPKDEWRRGVVVDAEQSLLSRTWAPPSPAHLLTAVRNARMRLVESEEHLLQVVLESLERYQAWLQGHTPSVVDLWNTGVSTRPKTEDELSDHVKRFLEGDLVEQGVVVNREVQIRRATPSGIGERTDIHVDAVTAPGQPISVARVKVIIEVKGCWNDELDTAMEKQLRDQYLRDASCTRGIYLVGLFQSERWDREDRRRRRCAALNLESARRRLAAQASSLSDSRMKIREVVLDLRLEPPESTT